MINFERFYSPLSTSICSPSIIFTFYLQGLFNWHHNMILLVLILILNWNFKLLIRHSILLLFSFVLLPFCFLYFFCILLLFALLLSYNYHCYLLITIIIYWPVYLFIYLFIYSYLLYHTIYLFCGIDLYKVKSFKSSPHIAFTAVNIAYL